MTEKDDVRVRVNANSEALIDLLNAMEAGIAVAKRHLADGYGVADPATSPLNSDTVAPATLALYDSLDWQTVHGTKGDYEQVKRSQTKTDVFDQLQADLKAHGNFMRRGGIQYWFHRDDQTVIDRRRK